MSIMSSFLLVCLNDEDPAPDPVDLLSGTFHGTELLPNEFGTEDLEFELELWPDGVGEESRCI